MKQFRKLTIASTVLIALTACGDGSNGSKKYNLPIIIKNNAPTASNDIIAAGKSWLPQQGACFG